MNAYAKTIKESVSEIRKYIKDSPNEETVLEFLETIEECAIDLSDENKNQETEISNLESTISNLEDETEYIE